MNRRVLKTIIFVMGWIYAYSVAAVDVQYTGRMVPDDTADLIMIPGSSHGYSVPWPTGLFGEGYVESPNQEEVLEQADAVVVARIAAMTPIGITGLEARYKGGNSHLSPPLVWWRVQCEVLDVRAGVFPYSELDFVVAHKTDHQFRPFVKGYVFYFALKQEQAGWIVEDQFRTSPISPYRLEDHADYYGLRRRHPSFDWSQANAFIQSIKDDMDRHCLDVSLEQGKYLIMTFGGEPLFGGLVLDYDRSVVAVTNEWTFPLPGE